MTTAVQPTNDTILVDLPRGRVFVKRQTNRELLDAALAIAERQSGEALEFPIQYRVVEVLLGVMGYRMDRDCLNYLCKSGTYPKPDKDEQGRFLFSKGDVVKLADRLEDMRRWLPLHPCHCHKYTPDERAAAYVEASKRTAALGAFIEMSLSDVLNLLADCTDRTTRLQLAYVAKVKTGLIDPNATANHPVADQPFSIGEQN